jgi:hypothetical protein
LYEINQAQINPLFHSVSPATDDAVPEYFCLFVSVNIDAL